MLFFALIGLFDRLIGNKLGLGTEFEKGINLLGTLLLTMTGMIVLAPFLADIMTPLFNFVYTKAGIDPSVLTSSVFANDMGGAQLAKAVCKSESLGAFNGLVIGSMMGATISFTVPFAVGYLGRKHQKEFTLGLLCGIVTVPLGCLAGGLIGGISATAVLINLIPLTAFAGILSLTLLFFPKACIRAFKWFGIFIKVLVSAGLAFGMIRFLTGYEIVKGLGTFEEGAEICLKCAVALSGAFPLLKILSLLLKKPLGLLSRLLKVNEKSTLGFISSMASNVPTFEMMKAMDKKGAVLNCAFAVSGSFVIADHLAFTLAFDGAYLGQVVVAKLVGGITAVIFADFIYKKVGKSVLTEEKDEK